MVKEPTGSYLYRTKHFGAFSFGAFLAHLRLVLIGLIHLCFSSVIVARWLYFDGVNGVWLHW